MTIYTALVIGLWALLIVVWLISALGAKRNVRTGGWWQWAAVRILIIVLVILFIERLHSAGYYYMAQVLSNPVVGVIGVILAAIGAAVAIWARMYLGRNWGMPMSLKENAELVTTGPYTYIRHPIYTGFLLMALGSALTVSPAWAIVVVVLGAYFIYSAVTEEKIMLHEFPNQYPAYKRRTKMLIPFIL